jgi:hypothetical protein
VFRKGIWQAVPFIVVVLVLSAMMGWVAWNALGSLTADAPAVLRIKNPR